MVLPPSPSIFLDVPSCFLLNIVLSPGTRFEDEGVSFQMVDQLTGGSSSRHFLTTSGFMNRDVFLSLYDGCVADACPSLVLFFRIPYPYPELDSVRILFQISCRSYESLAAGSSFFP